MATGWVGGGNGFKPDVGLAKIVKTRIPTINNKSNARIVRASQTENFMDQPAFPRNLPLKKWRYCQYSQDLKCVKKS
jgi:hypothetical protein